jgi:hypothetical protein
MHRIDRHAAYFDRRFLSRLEVHGSWQLPGGVPGNLPRATPSGLDLPAAGAWPVTLWQTALSNPQPDLEVAHINLRSSMSPAAPCVVALTVE